MALLDGPAKLITVGACLLLTWLFGQSQQRNLLDPGPVEHNLFILCCVGYAVIVLSQIWRMGRSAHEPRPRFTPRP